MLLLNKRRRASRKGRFARRAVSIALVGIAVAAAYRYGLVDREVARWTGRTQAPAAALVVSGGSAGNEDRSPLRIAAVPANAGLIREAASIYEDANDRQAVALLKTVVRLRPESVADHAALVLLCIRFGDISAARDALDAIDPRSAGEPQALNAALALAIATRDLSSANDIRQRLDAATSATAQERFSSACLRIRLPDSRVRDAAATELAAFASAESPLAADACRELADDCMRRRDVPGARAWLEKAIQAGGAAVKDRLKIAGLGLPVESRPADSVIADLAAAARSDAAGSAAIARWLIARNCPGDAVKLLDSLPAPVADSPSVRSALAQAVEQATDSDRLLNLVAGGVWGPVGDDTMRLIRAARTVDGSAHPTLRRETWRLVLESMGGNLDRLLIAEHLAAAWGWEEESRECLTAIISGFPDQAWAPHVLLEVFRQKGNGSEMSRVADVIHSRAPDVPKFTRDWALLRLLTAASADWNDAKEAMEHLYKSNPRNEAYIVGYAFALAQSRRVPESAAVIGGLSETGRDVPAFQPYLAYIYGVEKKGPGLSRAEALGAGHVYLHEETHLFTLAEEQVFNRPPQKPPAVPLRGPARPHS